MGKSILFFLVVIASKGQHIDIPIFKRKFLHLSSPQGRYGRAEYFATRGWRVRGVNFHAESFIQCQEDICGSSEKNVTVGDLYRKVITMKEEASFPASFHSMLDRIRKHYEGKRERLLSQLVRRRRFFEEDNLRINQDERKYLFSEFYFDLFFKNIDSITDDHDILLSTVKLLDEQSIRKNIPPHINTRIIPSALSALERISNYHHLQRGFYAVRHGSKELFAWENRDKSIQEIIDQETKRARKKIQKITMVAGSSFKSRGTIDADDPLDAQISTTGQIENFFEDILELNVILELFVDEDLNRGFNTITTYDQFYNMQSVVSRIDEITHEVQGIEDDFSGELSKCRDIIQNNYLALPTRRKLEAFKKRAEGVRKTAKEFIKSTFSAETALLVAQFLDGVMVKYPGTSDHILGNIEREIESVRKEEYGKGHGTIATDIGDVLYWDSVEDSFFDICPHLDEIFEIDIESIRDKSIFEKDIKYRPKGIVEVSWQSVKNPEYGEVIIAHEFSHQIKNFFKENHVSMADLRKFQKPRHCLSKMQPEARYNFLEERKILGRSESDPVTYSVSQFVEEDFADLFSFLVQGKTSPNLGCFLIDDTGGYWDRDVFYPYKPDPGDGLVKRGSSKIIRHSTDFFRMLHLEFLRQDHLPRSCQSFLLEEDIPFYPEDCSRHFFLLRDFSPRTWPAVVLK